MLTGEVWHPPLTMTGSSSVPRRTALFSGGVRTTSASVREVPISARATAAVLASLALVLGLWGVRRGDSMWRDESVTRQMAHRPFPALWDTLAQVDAVHGVYHAFMHLVFALWDGGMPALRLPSVLATRWRRPASP